MIVALRCILFIFLYNVLPRNSFGTHCIYVLTYSVAI
jgi:hypothetical protein